MVESESFIKEVSEELKRDRLFKALNKFKWPLFALIVLLVGAVGGYEYYKFDKKSRAQKNGEFLIFPARDFPGFWRNLYLLEKSPTTIEKTEKPLISPKF